MQFLLKIVLLFLIPSVLGSYKIIQENLTLEYVDKKYLDATAGCYKVEQNCAVNMTLKPKFDVPENFMVYAVGFKWMVDDYRLQIVQIQKTLKNAIEMELFDLQSLFVNHARPPVVWPIKKGTTYRMQGWIPDSTKFPPNLPGGKWKARVTGAFANKTKIAVFNWFVDIQ